MDGFLAKINLFFPFCVFFLLLIRRNEYTDWDRPSALDALSMRDSLSLALSDALVVAPLMHVVHLHAQRSANPSGTFFYHYQGQQQQTILSVPQYGQQLNDADLSEYHVRWATHHLWSSSSSLLLFYFCVCGG